jgi:hypothetical protein
LAVEEGTHLHPSSLVARAEPLAGLLGARRSPLPDVLLSFEQGNEFVPIERRELDGVPERVPDELASTEDSRNYTCRKCTAGRA